MSELYTNCCRTCLANASELICYNNRINFDGETFQLWEVFEKCTSLKVSTRSLRFSHPFAKDESCNLLCLFLILDKHK